MKKARFLLSVIFQLHKLNTYEWVGYVVQNGHCHRSDLIEVDENNLDKLGELVGSKLDSMSKELNATLVAGCAEISGGGKIPRAVYLLRSHGLVRI